LQEFCSNPRTGRFKKRHVKIYIPFFVPSCLVTKSLRSAINGYSMLDIQQLSFYKPGSVPPFVSSAPDLLSQTYFQITLPYAPCPIPYALCPMPFALCILIFRDRPPKPGHRIFNHVIIHAKRDAKIAGSVKTAAGNHQNTLFF